MVGGIDRYYQIATCWRDEDLRADRQFEFRQLDLEMAFVEMQDVLDVMEAAVAGAFEAVGRTPPPRPFPHLTYDEAMARYGSDKPDLRFGMEIQDATAVTRDSEFAVFKNAPCVRYIVVPRTFSRTEHDRLVAVAKEWGAKGVANLSQISKFLSPRELESFDVPDGSTALFVADDEEVVAHVLGLLRLHLARELDLIDPEKDVFHWVVDFPLFKHDEETGEWTFMHHPFTAPAPGTDSWDESDPSGVRGQHYDLVWNGWELGSGSIRIHDVAAQERVFRTMGLSDEEAHSKFGFLLEALAMGAPPHGGFAMGIERFVALLAGEPDIRQIVAFPKVSSGSDPLTGAPTPIPSSVLRDLGIAALEPEPSSAG
jgi:aspartyl-tRNA synthetase